MFSYTIFMNSLEYNKRARNWFLCVQQGAKCFYDVPIICERLNNCSFAYIKHDKETMTNGELVKEEHYHIILNFENARSFQSVTKHFAGAHVEESHNLADCAAYLLHNTPSAIAAGKKQYLFSEIITNNETAVRAWIGDKGVKYDVFNENKIVEYIFVNHCWSIFEFYSKFGAQIQKYIPLIDRLLKEVDLENNRALREYLEKCYQDNFGKNGYNRYSVN